MLSPSSRPMEVPPSGCCPVRGSVATESSLASWAAPVPAPSPSAASAHACSQLCAALNAAFGLAARSTASARCTPALCTARLYRRHAWRDETGALGTSTFGSNAPGPGSSIWVGTYACNRHSTQHLCSQQLHGCDLSAQLTDAAASSLGLFSTQHESALLLWRGRYQQPCSHMP